MTTITVTNSGSSAYIINGASNPTISLVRGNTYNLVINASGHPFLIKNGGTTLGPNDGVTNNGASVGTITYVVPNNAPNTLSYVCQNHSNMTGTINITGAGTIVTTVLSNFSIPTKTVGDSPFQITPPTTNSNGAFTYTSSNTSVATIAGTTITIVGVGNSTITATQVATSNYTSATITASLIVNIATTVLSNFSIPTKTVGDSPFQITPPTTNSNGAFTYTSSNTSVATIDGTTITIVGVGSSTITATQAATTNYTSATITASLIVNAAAILTPTVLSNFSIPTKTVGDSPFQITPPTTNSDGAFSYTSSNTSVATIAGTTITIVGAGSSIITAAQAATSTHTSGTTSSTLVVNTATTVLSNFSIPTKTVGDSPFQITPPTTNSNGAFTYTSSNTSVATIAGTIITIVGVGNSTITATQAATTNYTSETITATLTINKSTICLTNISIVNVVSSNGNKYVFNNGTTYDSNIVYGLGIDTYVFKNIPEGHPIALLNSGKTDSITYSGDSTKKLTKVVDGVSYDFYYEDITVQVSGDFGSLSVYCYYHGYMGGENLLKYSSSCTIAPVCLTNPSIVNIVASNGNKYVFNNGITYDSNIVYGLGIGTYVFKNIAHFTPMALLNSGKTNTITYSGGSNNKLTKSVYGVSYDFYYGDITVQVLGNFGTISIYCYHHGYMGGENLLKYSSSCYIEPINSQPINYNLRNSMRSIFTNNAQLYYKPNSLSTGGGGSGVRNSRHKQFRT